MQLWLQGGKGEEGKEYDIYEPFFKSSNAWRVVGEGGGGREFISFEFDALLSAFYCKLYQAD